MSEQPSPQMIEEIYRREALHALREDPPVMPDERLLRPLVPFFWMAGRIPEALAAMHLLERYGDLILRELQMRGYWALHLGESQQAFQTFRDALQLDASDVNSRSGYAFALFFLDRYAEAARVFQGLVDEGTELTSPAIMAAASAALASGRQPEEIKMPPLPGLPPGLSEVLQIKSLHGQEAAIQQARALLAQLAPEHQLILWRVLLECELELRHEQQIAPEIDHLFEQYPDDGMLWYLKGIAARRLQQRDESHTAFETATAMIPFEARGWAAYGAGWVERQDFERAKTNYRIALLLEASNANFWSDLGLSEAAVGSFAEAKEAFTRSIDLGDHSFTTYFNRGICSLNLGEHAAAMEDWERALAVDPQHYRAEEVRQLLSTADTKDDERFVFGDIDDEG